MQMKTPIAPSRTIQSNGRPYAVRAIKMEAKTSFQQLKERKTLMIVQAARL